MDTEESSREPTTTVLVVGGTGAMGSAVVRRFLGTTSSHVRVLTRTVDSPASRELRRSGGARLTLVEGDLDEPSTLLAAMDGVDRVFANTDFFSSRSVRAEVRQGLALLDAAQQAGVDRFVWSSLDDAARLSEGRTPVPHFDAKASVAAAIHLGRADEVMREEVDGWFTDHVSVLTTAPYFENLLTTMRPDVETLDDGSSGVVIRLPLAGARYPFIALDDIAWFAVHVLEHWQSWGARDLAIVADALTGDQIAAAVARALGRPARYEDLPLDVLRRSLPGIGHDYAAMARYLQERDVFALDRDVALLRRIHPNLRRFEDWLADAGAALLEPRA